ncbi:MAG: hypothetical protein HXY30_12850 [Pseudorhodoplanes sp.]|nr:hypothetical protein [Pseudorhodoplanes sp.]
MTRLPAAALGLALAGSAFAATDANAVVYCKTVGVPKGCVVRPVVVAPSTVVVTPKVVTPVVVAPRRVYRRTVIVR